MMAEPQTVRIAAHGLTVAADYWAGTGTPVVFAHGGGQTRHSWGGAATRLADAGRTVLSVDLRGHGDSDWAEPDRYLTEDFAADAATAIRWLGQPCHWVGASMGGLTGLLATKMYPDLFRSLVLVDITARPSRAGVDRIVEFMTKDLEVGFASLEDAAVAVAEYQPHRPKPPDPSGLAKNLRQGPDGRWRWHWDPAFMAARGNRRSGDDSWYQPIEDAARELTIPTLLVRGRLSDLVTEAEAQEFLALVPHARLVDVADAAHMVAGDRNDRFSAAVVEFLDELSPDQNQRAS